MCATFIEKVEDRAQRVESPEPPNSVRSFLTELLAEQQRLDTPVARFSRTHDAIPRSQLIPLTAPGPGEQYAFEVDLDACTGCKACVSACHSLNGLDENETWRDTGLLVGGTELHPFQQVVTTACHHCADPGCLNGCPVLAYEKDPRTGIVLHLDDQCIGCQYCVLKCPYDVPKYNGRRGIVRKCDMCHGRLAAGESPACAQACPTHAIRITTVRIHTAPDGSPQADTSLFLRCAPAPDTTLPTTRYISQRTFPKNLRAADAAALRPQPPHWPLVWMLVLTQFSVGVLAAALFFQQSKLVAYYMTTAWATAALGLAASVLHLGQPLKAWRCFLGLRRSWMSREIVIFAAYFVAMTWLAATRREHLLLTLGALATGVAGIFSSVMIYADTRRQVWRFPIVVGKFFSTAAIASLGLFSLPAAAAMLAAKLAFESATLRGGSVNARLQRGPLRPVVALRFVLGATAALAFACGRQAPGFFLFSLGELAERYLFFRAVDAPKMPGLPAA